MTSLFEDEADAWGASSNAWSVPQLAVASEKPWNDPFQQSLDDAVELQADPIEETQDVWAPQITDSAGEFKATAEQDDFDDFGTTQTNADDFGDDFEEFQTFEAQEPAVPIASTSHLALDTRPISANQGPLEPQIHAILNTLYPGATNGLITEEAVKEISDPKQLLAPSALELFESLSKPSQPTLTATWKRSQIRKMHLNALGIQVELIEQPQVTKSQSDSKPTVSVQTDSIQRLASPRSAPPTTSSQADNHRPISRSSTPLPSAPILDRRKASELIGMTASALGGLSLAELHEIQSSLEELVRQASEVLTYEVEKREKLKADGETYDQMIQDLVSTAQKLKNTNMSSSSQASIKRTGSMSNRIFGARANSPNFNNSTRSNLH